MRNKGIIALIFIGIGLLSLGLASAGFKYNSDSLKESYLAGESIKGKINLNLSSENGNNLVTSNFLGNISLLSLLNESGLEEGIDFNCTTKECGKEFETGRAKSEIELNKEKFIGLKISGKGISGIDSMKFSIESELTGSCEIPLLIDITGKGDKILTSNTHTSNYCTDNNYGCFADNLGSSEYTEAIINGEICENINLSAGPAFSLGAKIKKVNEENITMILRDFENNDLGECDLPKISGAVGTEQEAECIVEYSSAKKGSYWACASGEFKIRSETKEPMCGTDETDFEIFAKPMGYGRTEMGINSTTFEILTSEILENYAYDYLKEIYGDAVDCNPYCILPVKISGPSQIISLSDVELMYDLGSYKKEAKEFYELSEKPVLIDGKNIEIDIAPVNFVIPLGSTNKQLLLYLGEVLLKKKDITIQKSFDFDITPKFSYLGLKSTFEVVTNYNITSSKWNFGDGTIEETKGKKITHAYTESKTYNVEVEIARNDGVVAIKSFTITAGNAKESADRTIKEYKARLANITKQTEGFPAWTSKEIKEAINFSELGNSLNELESSFKEASSDEEYEKIMNELLALRFPSSISTGKRGKLPLAIGFENIDSRYYKEILNNENFNSDNLNNLIIGWFNKNYKADVNFEQISIFRDSSAETLATKFKLDIAANEGAENGNLFIDYPFESVVFKEGYGQKPISDGAAAYIPIKSERKSIEFLIIGEISADELGAYIASTRAFATDNGEICEANDLECAVPFPWGRLLFWLGISNFGVLVIYIILQEWYKRKYEYRLFKNTHDLYNLINFIYNSRVSGLTDKDIRKKLSEVGWKGEKITYALKKIDGRRTGMWEIPLFMGFENRRVKQEIVKRQGGQPIDARFIKRPAF